jgi:hypothetical protein
MIDAMKAAAHLLLALSLVLATALGIVGAFAPGSGVRWWHRLVSFGIGFMALSLIFRSCGR